YEARASDIFIAVMGMTGSGKSSFISMCTDEKVEVGHGLEGCTQRVRPYKCKWSNSANVYLVDTPGFDDTARSDTEVLKEIAAWLNDSYKENVLLRGVLYLQSITDPRMQGTAKRHIWMFKKLCGPSALQNVLLVTTMWDKVQPEVGKAHEHELVSTREFWGWMIGKGSQAHRHDNTRGSAMSLLNVLVARGPKWERALDLQVDMVDCRLSLSDTKAGQEVEGTIRRRTEKFQCEIEELRKQMREALSSKDKKAIDMLTEQQEQMQVAIWRMEHDREQLRVNAEKLHA
ncbi:P-loop containing nucleoside triphosphate hydrolase protein, partial [Thozetella sp. PMI_491]